MKNNNKQPDVYVPTREEFDEFCAHSKNEHDCVPYTLHHNFLCRHHDSFLLDEILSIVL